MDFRDPTDRASLPQPPQPTAPADETKPGFAAALVSVVCGLAACVLNLLVVTAPLGFLFGIIGLVSGIVARIKGAGRSGLVLTFVSMLILLIYSASLLVPLLADPTVRLMPG